MNEQQRELFRIQIATYQDGTMSSDDFHEFEKSLQEDLEKAKLFMQMQSHSFTIAELFAQDAITANQVNGAVSRSLRPSHRILYGFLAMATCLIAGFVLPFRTMKSGPSGHATLTYANSCSWGGGHVPARGNYLLYHTPYDLTHGVVRLEMGGGSIVSVAAPASFQVIDGSSIDLESGKLVARMLREESTLEVKAGDLLVRDRGKAFGMEANRNGTIDVTALDGGVEIRPFNQIDSRRITYERGMSIEYSGRSKRVSEVPFDATKYEEIWPLAAGVDEVSDLIEFVPPAASLDITSLQDDHKLFLIAEQLDRQVEQEIPFAVLEPGLDWPKVKGPRRSIEPGETLSSYLLVYQPLAPTDPTIERRISRSGSITFENPIRGVSIWRNQLKRTDKVFGLPDVDYSAIEFRHLEDKATEEGLLSGDTIVISEDGRTINFTFHVGAGRDHLRIFVLPQL
ncbi:FecR protein [Rhodopirellula sallentina]|uniref:FecR protein domain protein n=1 Tax=Rhodopirellula sallentina SM41 TaxID=1263870 RepID=M5U6Z2_9BACT|nr:FecR protein [Rhodopirellula sallentina]EMI57059.1 FecR protein domain protein [Rhodopirellula sallentina SM41]